MTRYSPNCTLSITLFLIFSITFQPLPAQASSLLRLKAQSRATSAESWNAANKHGSQSTDSVQTNKSIEQAVSPAAVGPITATNRDSFPDPNLDGKVQQGETITYTVTITNTGTNDALNVVYNDTVDLNTSTLVAGSPGISPIIVGDSYSAIGNVKINSANIVGAGHSVLDNDPAGSTVSGFGSSQATANTTVPNGSNTVTTANNGTVLMNSDGTFTYNPAAGFSGTDSFFYSVSNSFGPGTAKVTITVSNTIWFINNAAAQNGDGRLTTPFNSIANYNASLPTKDPNDIIFIYTGSGPYTGNLSLANGMQLIGQGVDLASVTGISAPAGSDPLPGAASSPVVTNAATIVTLPGSNGTSTIRGINLNPSAGFAITGNGNGSTTIDTVNLNPSSTSGGISLINSTGTLTYGTGTITNSGSGAAVAVSGGTLSATFTGSITQSGNAAMLSVTGGHNTGTITFQTGILSATNGTGLQFDNADGTYNFNGTTTLNGGDAGIDILNDSAGTFSFGSNTTITSPTGTAFNVSRGAAATCNPAVTYSGSITENNAQRLINIDGTTANTITFQTGTITGGASSTGVNINNANGNLTFANLNLGTNASRMTNQALTITSGTGTYNLGALSIFTNNAAGIVATNADGTINITSGTVNSTVGSAINISGPAGITTMGITLTTVNSTGGANNLNVTNAGGTLTINGGALSGATGTAFNVSGSNPAVTYAGSVTQNNAQRVVDVQNTTGGSVSFTDSTNGVTGGASSTGVNINNANGNVNFAKLTLGTSGSRITNQAVTIANGASSATYSLGTISIFTNNQAGMVATNFDGTLNITTGNVDSTNATAISIDGPVGLTTLGIALTKVSANGGANGIFIQDTNGSFTITGNSSGNCGGDANPAGTATAPDSNDCTGGTIQNMSGSDGATSGTGIYLNNAQNISLTRVKLNDHQNWAIHGVSVAGLVMNNIYITGTNGTSTATDEGSVSFDNLTGSASVTESYFEGGFEDNFRVVNTSGTLNRITFTGDTIGHNSNTGNDGILLAGYSTATVNATVQNCRFTGSRSNNIQYAANESAAGDVVISGNKVTNNQASKLGSDFGIYVSHASTGNVTYTVTGNSVNDAGGSGIEVDRLAGGTGSMTGSVTTNTVGTAGVANSGSSAGSAIFIGLVSAGSTATHTAMVTGNTVRQFTNYGIRVVNRGPGTSYLNASVKNNNIAEPSPNAASGLFPTSGLRFELGASSGPPPDDGLSCLDISGNTLTNTGTNGGAELRIFGRFSTKTSLPGLGLNGASSNANTFLANQNTITTSGTAVSATSTNAFQSTCPPSLAMMTTDTSGMRTASAEPSLSSETVPAIAVASSMLSSIVAESTEMARADKSITKGFSYDRSFTPLPEPLKVGPSIVYASAKPFVPAYNIAYGNSNHFSHEREGMLNHTSRTRTTSNTNANTGNTSTTTAHNNTVTPTVGGTVSVNIGTLPAGSSVTIIYQVTVNNAAPAGATFVRDQGTVTGSNIGASLVTDDPDTVTTNDETRTPLVHPSAAQSTISGKVLDESGSSLGGVVIQLSDGRRTITRGDGAYRFDSVQSGEFYTLIPQLANHTFSPRVRSLSLLADVTDATFTATSDATQTSNPLDTDMYFVREQYLDFLGREPDEDGLQYWTARIADCGTNQECIHERDIEVSAAFFYSAEYQQTGDFVYRMYEGGLGRQSDYSEFNSDRQKIVGAATTDEGRKAFADAFVRRDEFLQKYQQAASADSFITALIETMRQSSGVDLTAQRDSLIARYNQSADINGSRSLALIEAINSSNFMQAEYNRSFVLIEYFGYLKRNADQGGYQFWLDVLNNKAPENYRAMVCAFITSTEYQRRFSSVATYANSDCR